MKMNKKIILFAILIIMFTFGLGLRTKADSGWDSSYDSDWGSSWDSDSSWDSGSSWDSDSSWDSNSSSGSSGEGNIGGEFFIFLFVSIALVGIMYCTINALSNAVSKLIRKIPSSTYNYTHERSYIEMPEEQFNTIIKDISMEDLRQKAFEIYKDIQYAWTNFDYDKIRLLTTDEIYNMYSSQLSALEIKNQANIMSEISLKSAKILSAKEENGITTIESYLIVTCYDYVIDKLTKKVLRGLQNDKLEIRYIITLVKDSNSQRNNITKCPSCGAEVNMVSSGVCEYCKNVLVQNPSDYVMSKKECVGQRKI